MTTPALPDKIPALPDKIIAIDRALDPLPHAFGGALALAYYAEPRATADIDVNVFVPVDEFERVHTRLAPLGIAAATGQAQRVRRDGQIRLAWGHNPVDLFFSYDPFHDAAAGATQRVPFAATTIPILAAEHLVVCKAVFDRPKDWVDIDAIRAAGTTLDAAEVIRWVQRIVGDTDPRYERIVGVLARPAPR